MMRSNVCSYDNGSKCSVGKDKIILGQFFNLFLFIWSSFFYIILECHVVQINYFYYSKWNQDQF